MIIRTVIFLSICVPTLARAGLEKKISPAELPAVALKTLDQDYPGARILEAEREEKKGRVEYEVKFCRDGRKFEVEFDQQGRVTDVDDEGAC